MPKFFYQAYTKSKEKKEGVIEAENKMQALERLDRLSLFPVGIKLSDGIDNEEVVRIRGRVKFSDIVTFSRQISNLLDSGLTILAALMLVLKQTLKPSLKSVIEEIIEDLKEGKTFSYSLSRHPNIFSGLYVSLIKSGETGGFLEDTMKRIADFMESEEELRAKVRSAMIYPILIAIVGIITIFVLLSFVVPKLVLVFEDFGQTLPLPTQVLVSLSYLLSRYWWLVVLFITLIIFIINRISKTQEGRIFIDRFKLKIPVLGTIVLKRQIERFCRILATLLGNGVTILPSLEVVRDIMENNILKREIEKMRLEIRDGSSLTKAMSKSRHFPVSVINIISVGEESGSLEKVLQKISANYEREIDRDLRDFTSLLEPLMILVMGLIVAFIVTAMLLPIFQINFMAR
ncbi:MAG: type II secretion system F family protein [Candidatus Omnitrophica bacterium]|nr:type II secretion system F family protein [Candidatus Omnitrophota bacterium]MDD5351784.1 type II secretion system F family protein [Candidatus Omnitrophota bacterium]MDD5550610.1 type II secretion system F family protein [Candidatus Omnitrophota bacterium]